MFGYPCIFGFPLWMPPYAWTPPCLNAHICLDDVWMPLYIHNTKKACFVRLRVSICPHIFGGRPVCLDAPYVWMHPCMFGCPHMFGCPLYVWMPHVWIPPVCFDTPICLDSPICLDAPICLGASYVWTPLCMVGCLRCLDTPYMFGYTPVSLDAPKCIGVSKGMRDIQTYGHVQIFGSFQTYKGASKYMGHLNMGESKCMEGIWRPHQSDKACFLCVVYVQQASKHLPNIQGHPNIWRACKHMGLSKHTGGI